MNGFTEALRQEVTKRHVRVGVLEPGGVTTELMSHNSGTVREEIDHFHFTTDVQIAEGITAPRLHQRTLDYAHRPSLT